MTPTDLQVIRSTFRTAAADPHGFLTEFRRRALKADPTLRPVLPAIDRSQAASIFAILAAMLDGVSSDGASLAVKDLARQHRLRDIQPRHYGAIGQAMLDTLSAQSGTAFTDSARTAWVDAYVMFAEALMAQCYNPLELVA